MTGAGHRRFFLQQHSEGADGTFDDTANALLLKMNARLLFEGTDQRAIIFADGEQGVAFGL